MKKRSQHKLKIVGLAIVVLLICFALVVYLQFEKEADSYGTEPKIPSINTGDRQECPEAWYEDFMPPVPEDAKPEDRQYMIIDGDAVPVSEIDIEWVAENCEVNKPEAVF